MVESTELFENRLKVGLSSPLGNSLNESTSQLWYAVYTSANHEKRVAEQFGFREVEHFLPLYASRRKWKDRHVTLQLPLFPSYVFVRIAERDRLRVLQVPGVAHLIAFAGRPVPIAEEELLQIRGILGTGAHVEPHPYLVPGKRVRVRNGALRGLVGKITRRKNRARLVVSIDLIQRAVAVEMDEGDLELLP